MQTEITEEQTERLRRAGSKAGLLGIALWDDTQRDVAEAVRRVENGEVARATVTLTFTVRDDEKEGLKVEFTLKSQRTVKGDLPISHTPRLPLEE